jgi:hypothetical protein
VRPQVKVAFSAHENKSEKRGHPLKGTCQELSIPSPEFALGRKKLFHWLNIFYEDNFKTPSGFPLTYEIYYVTAQKG